MLALLLEYLWSACIVSKMNLLEWSNHTFTTIFAFYTIRIMKLKPGLCILFCCGSCGVLVFFHPTQETSLPQPPKADVWTLHHSLPRTVAVCVGSSTGRLEQGLVSGCGFGSPCTPADGVHVDVSRCNSSLHPAGDCLRRTSCNSAPQPIDSDFL